MSEFKENDVILYRRGKSVAIVDHCYEGGTIRVKAWKHSDAPYGWMEDGTLSNITEPPGPRLPHPDPDAVWADYVAWRLTQ